MSFLKTLDKQSNADLVNDVAEHLELLVSQLPSFSPPSFARKDFQLAFEGPLSHVSAQVVETLTQWLSGLPKEVLSGAIVSLAKGVVDGQKRVLSGAAPPPPHGAI